MLEQRGTDDRPGGARAQHDADLRVLHGNRHQLDTGRVDQDAVAVRVKNVQARQDRPGTLHLDRGAFRLAIGIDRAGAGRRFHLDAVGVDQRRQRRLDDDARHLDDDAATTREAVGGKDRIPQGPGTGVARARNHEFGVLRAHPRERPDARCVR